MDTFQQYARYRPLSDAEEPVEGILCHRTRVLGINQRYRTVVFHEFNCLLNRGDTDPLVETRLCPGIPYPV